MKVFLLAVLVCLVSATEEPLRISGNFQTIYLASKSTSVVGENSEFRMLMREVTFFEKYTLMRMTFYVRKNGKCQLHTVWADKSPFKFCATISFSDLVKCFKNSENEFIVGTWVLRDSIRHFTQIYTHPEIEGGRTRTRGPIITEEMWKEYVNLTCYYGIPIRNIKNVYEADTCPK